MEIKVLDFTLPKPGCYADAEREFAVCSYIYNCFGMIMEMNGGDYELATRQFKAQMVDLVAHGQTLNWLRWGLNAESVTCWQLMKEAGMRMDTLVGGAGVKMLKTKEEMLSAARRQKEGANRLYGPIRDHFIGHGDEPPQKWLVEQRPLYEAYQDAGFKFIIAGSDGVFRKAGYLYDWHNIAKPPENDSTPRLWNQLGSAPKVAWYANMHTGPENPEFNRRQNGFAAYLSGYTALCNYCHEFGAYNDDSVGYRPMILAYGHYRGSIDTLQWEGFREGVDDIRYATLAVKLAREAAKSSEAKVRYAGNLVLQYLADFDRDRGDLQACRMEMISRILRLREVLGMRDEGRGREEGTGNREQGVEEK